jgi:LytS/YehU family sensor histidine kinase
LIRRRYKQLGNINFLNTSFRRKCYKTWNETTKIPLQIKIFTKKMGENGLLIGVENSGYFIENKNNGIGLENIKLRLNNAYPNNHKFTILEENGFVKVEINIYNLKLFLNEN